MTESASPLLVAQDQARSNFAALTEAQSQIVDLTNQLATVNARLTAANTRADKAVAEVATLQARLADDEGRIAERAQSFLAASGHPAPLNISTDEAYAGGGSPKSGLTGLARAAAHTAKQFQNGGRE